MAVTAKKRAAEKVLPAPEFKDFQASLRQNGAERVYILYGEEDYLRDMYLAELRAACVDADTEAFNYHKISGDPMDMEELRAAVEAMPFMGERTFIEIQNFDINKTASYQPDQLTAMLKDVPDWATLAFVFPPDYSFDKRLSAVKTLRTVGVELYFPYASEAKLTRWIIRRFAAEGKTIRAPEARYMSEVCGCAMKTLIPEIVKVAAYASGETVQQSDIDAGARKAPEIKVFDMIDAMAARNFGKAAGLMGELLNDPDEAPQKQIYLISDQFRRMYIAKVAAETRQGDSYIQQCLPDLKARTFLLNRIKNSCRPVKLAQLEKAVVLCAECDYQMKNTGPDSADLLKELLIQLNLCLK